MKIVDPELRPAANPSRRAALADFIAGQTSSPNFKLSDWLQTLETCELQRIEEDAQNCCQDGFPESLSDIEVVDLVEAALMAYFAELSFEVSREDALDCLDDLLIGLSVVACIERLERAGWLVITDRMSILVGHSQPYRVTYKGFKEGIWSDEPLTLWILGASLDLH